SGDFGTNLWNYIFGASTNATNAWNELEAFLTTGNWQDLLNAVTDLIGVSPINVEQLFGQLFPGLFSNVPSTAITSAPGNLLYNGGFSGATAVQGGTDWLQDSTVYYPLEGVAAPGSVMVTADGTLKELASEAKNVGTGAQLVPGQEIVYSVQALTTGLSGSGTPVQMGVLTNL